MNIKMIDIKIKILLFFEKTIKLFPFDEKGCKCHFSPNNVIFTNCKIKHDETHF